MTIHYIHRLALGAILLAAPAPAFAQIPLAPLRASGQTVTPVFEGWYRNADGSYSLSFGYYNRNTAEEIDVPLGPDNSIEPRTDDGAQPTHFMPRRNWGVFAVRVPPDFGERKVVWTLNVRGQTFAIPGSLKKGWEIDAIAGEADTGNKPPVLKFVADGAQGAGPAGVMFGPLNAKVGTPLELVVFASDDGRASSGIASDGRENVPVILAWFRYQGPGGVAFANAAPQVDAATGKAVTTATFTVPGEYILRVRANDASGVVGGGHAQCCWTNGFVRVSVR
jgi:hypothetical protein